MHRYVFYATFTIPPLRKNLEKKRFHNLLYNYTSLTHEEAQELISLENQFPYSQVIHSLAARATQDNKLQEKEEQLHLGAIYITDRSVFKSIMTALPEERKMESGEIMRVTEEVIENPRAEVMPAPVKKVKENAAATESQASSEVSPSLVYLSSEHAIDESFYSELAHDLEKLKMRKHEFEETVRQFENGTLSHSVEADSGHKKKNKHIEPSDDLLTEIKSTKKKIKSQGPGQKEQIDIIEQFIKTQPTIKGKVVAEEKAVPKDDLSEKSLLYNENIISETLVEILLKQGKNDKAVEVLKKLIWKFPQKKAYFAAQIEDLKK